MSTGGLALLLYNSPRNFTGLITIGKVIYLLDLVFFVSLTATIVARFILFPSSLKASLVHPNESLFFPTFLLSLAAILSNAAGYGSPSSGSWLGEALWILFWIYTAISIVGAIAQFILLFSGSRLPVHSMTPVWMLPIFPAMLVGTVAVSLLAHQPVERAPTLIITGLTCQGLGWSGGLFLYPLYLGRLMQDGLPASGMRPAMFIAVGPPGFTSVAIIGLSASIPSGIGYFASHPYAIEILQVVALWASVFLWCLSFWFFAIATCAVLMSALQNQLQFTMAWWAFVFPNVGFTISTAKIGENLESEAIQWIACAMIILIAGMWLLVLGVLLMKILKQTLFSSGRSRSEHM